MKVDFSRTILNAIPSPVLVVDEDVRVVDSNSAAVKLLEGEGQELLRQRSGEWLHCMNASHSPEGCGHGPNCSECVIRNSVQASFQGNQLTRQRTTMDLVLNGTSRTVEFLITATPIEFDARHLTLLILEDVTELVHLRSLLPICARCKKIRDDQAYWHKLENYMTDRLQVDLTHGICPGCSEELLAELNTSP